MVSRLANYCSWPGFLAAVVLIFGAWALAGCIDGSGTPADVARCEALLVRSGEVLDRCTDALCECVAACAQ